MSNTEAAIASLLDGRDFDTTVCPSEVARRLANDGDWRERMEDVHQAVDRMLDDGRICLSWKGTELAQRHGPYRIGRPSA